MLTVYGLVTKEGATDHGKLKSISNNECAKFLIFCFPIIGIQHNLQLLYEHKLRRSAYNFCLGPFGGTQNRDFISVQSLDGLLTFFEQESFAFCCFLPDFLLPGPLVFVSKVDSFVTSNSNWQITSFK